MIIDKEWQDRGLSQAALNLILKEDVAQIEKWGYQKRRLFEWLAYITEELGELSEAMSEYLYRDGALEDIPKEAVQVATLALKVAHMTYSVATYSEESEMG